MANPENQAVYPSVTQYVVARGKVPVDPETGMPVKASNPIYQMSRDKAEHISAQKGLNVGFVLTESDPYWCLDLDNCRDPITGSWNAQAEDVGAKFRHSLQEISISGTGLHIWGAFESREGWEAYRNRDESRGIEFYFRKRFLVINPSTAGGSCETRSDEPLRSILRRREGEAPNSSITPAHRLPTLPSPISELDRALVDRALQDGLSPLAAAGKAPSFRQLWERHTVALAHFFPTSDARGFDYSAADAALARELLILCGGDCERATRLIWHSSLKRDKWDRPDYLPRTMENAAKRSATAVNRKASRSADEAFQGRPAPELPPGSRPFGLPLVQASTLVGPPPPMTYVVQDWIPAGFVTLLYGDGGTGKSYLMTILSIVLAARDRPRTWLGVPVNHGPVIFFSAEDNRDVLHGRIDAICDSHDIDVGELKAFHIAFMSGEDATLFTGERGSTPVLDQLKQRIDEIRPRLVVIDTAADVFDGDENNKSEVRKFLRSLAKIADGTETGIVLLAHPSKSGMDTGRHDAGSVSWNATARARITYRIDKENPQLRHLELAKNNHGPDKLRITVAWRDGTFQRSGLTNRDEETAAERQFLELLDMFEAQGRNVNANSGPYHAPSFFARHPEAGGFTKEAFRRAMERLFSKGKIRNEKANRAFRVVRASSEADTVGDAISPATPVFPKYLPSNSPSTPSQLPGISGAHLPPIPP